MNSRFDLNGPGWVGGDSAYSVALADGRTLWLFSDSLIGSVEPSGELGEGSSLIHNSMLVEENGKLRTITGQSGGQPRSFFTDPSTNEWYWVHDARTLDNTMWVFLVRMKKTDKDLGFDWQGGALAQVSLTDLSLTRIDSIPAPKKIRWGAGLLDADGYTYIYGQQTSDSTALPRKYLHIARAPKGRLAHLGEWEYRTASGWSKDPHESRRILIGISDELSVSPYRDGYMLITTDSLKPFSRGIRALTSCTPFGPWQYPTLIYQAPEGLVPNHITYNAHAHPGLSSARELVITYNVNTLDKSELWRNPRLYRPRFITLPLIGS